MVKKNKINNLFTIFKVSFLCNICQNLFSMSYILLQAWLFSDMVSFAIQYRYGQMIQKSVHLVILTSVCFGINFLLKYKLDMSNEMNYQIFREDIVNLFFSQSRKKVVQFSPGEIRRSIDVDAKKIADYYCIVLPVIITNSFFIFVTIYLFMKHSIILGVIFIILSTIQIFPHALVSFFSYKYYDADREAQAKWTENLMSMYFGNATIKLYELHSLFSNKLKSLNKKWDKLGRKSSAVGRISEGVSSLIESILQVFSYLILGFFLLQGELDFSEGTYLLVLAPKLFAYTNSIFAVFPQIVEYRKAKENIEEWKMNTYTKNLNVACSKIIVDSVCIKYGNSSILKDFSCEIDLSRRYYIVGQNGSGKTSLLECILGINDIDSGKILYDNCDVGWFSEYQSDNQFMYLSQEDATLNLKACELFFEDNCTQRDRALQIAKKFGLEDKCIYSTLICDLSGGERKKIYLSLALAMENKFLFLDEPTNYLDTKSVQVLLLMIKQRKAGSLIITHDMRLIENDVDATVYSL